MSDAFRLVLAAIDNTVADPEMGCKYFRRPSGSYVPALRAEGDSEGPMAVAALRVATETACVEITKEVRKAGTSFGKCRYFKVPLPGVEAACLFSDLPLGTVLAVVVGQHGVELVAPGVQPQMVNFSTICVGSGENPEEEPTRENARVYFWAPGRVLPRQTIAPVVKLG
jgi:hypothetical protein